MNGENTSSDFEIINEGKLVVSRDFAKDSNLFIYQNDYLVTNKNSRPGTDAVQSPHNPILSPVNNTAEVKIKK